MRTLSEMPITEARDHLGDIVNRAQHGGRHTILTRNGKRVAVVISFEDHEGLRGLYEAAEDAQDLAATREALADPAPRIPHSEIVARYETDGGRNE